MSIIALDYGQLQKAVKASNQTARECDDFCNEIQQKVTKKLDSLERGSSANTAQANYFARQKMTLLNSKRDACNNFSRKASEISEYARTTDSRVSQYINAECKVFRSRHNMNVDIITELFTWLSTGILNKSSFGRWLRQKMKGCKAWLSKKKREVKRWIYLEGGKYIIKTVLYVVGTVIAGVVLVAVAGPTLAALAAAIAGSSVWTAVTAAAGFVASAMAVADNWTKALGNLEAALINKEDPGWAQRKAGYSSFADFLKKARFSSGEANIRSNMMSNGLKFTATIASVINLTDLTKRVYNFRLSLSDPYVKTTLFKKLSFSNPKSGKTTWQTVKYGLRTIKQNYTTLKTQLGLTNINRLNSYYKKELGNTFINIEKVHGYVKNIFSTNSLFNDIKKITTDKIRSKTIVWNNAHKYKSLFSF